MKPVQNAAARPGCLSRFRRDRQGVAAVEFALIAPVLFMLYFGMAELCTVMMADRRATHADSAIGDLAAQTDRLRDGDITDIWAAATTVLAPFDPAPLQMRLTSVTLNANKEPKVEWSAARSGQADLPEQTCNDPVANFPAALKTAAGDNLVMAEAVYSYKSPLGFMMRQDFTFKPRYYMRPRTAAKVARYKGASTTPVVCNVT